MADEKDVGFKVTDRRKFNPDGTPRSDSADEQKPEPTAQPGPPDSRARVIEFPGETAKRKEKADESELQSVASEPSDWSAGAHHHQGMPEASFENLINMLAVEAVMHLGLIENPAGGHSVDLDAARHMIDMLGMLEAKTRGNLDRNETELIESVLSDLRMQFVAVSRSR